MQEYVAKRGEYLEAERFTLIAVEPNGMSAKSPDRGGAFGGRYEKIDGRMRQCNGGSISRRWCVVCITCER